MRYLVTTLLLLCSFQYSIGQSFTIKGIITDTLNSTPLHRASIVLVRTTDSVIETFTRSAPDGRFELRVNKNGKYLLKVSFPSFADHLETINIRKSNIDLGVVPMISKERLLQEYVLTQQVSAIKIKGDTTEYMADSFKVKENATVEDLLKKLPGIQVDNNGNVTAQGETVQKILVDGEEFFSDDPKVVMKGLQANAVAKVQVYDKKSDQAEFTGIDDGQKQKTINLELKDEKKKGYFGKVDAGGGTDGFFQNQAMINAFRRKRQLSAFGIASNTDKVGLGWQDNDKFGSGNGVTEISDDGGIITTITSSSDDDFGGWNGKYNGQGFPKTWTGGVHYADKWNADKNHVTGNYRYARQNVEMDGSTTTQFVQGGDSSLINDQRKSQFSRGDRHGIDAMYEGKIDSNTTIKVTANAGLKNSETYSRYNTITTLLRGDADTNILNTNDRVIRSNADALFINADLLLRHKFKKKGRTLAVDVKENYKDSKSDGTLESTTNIAGFDIETDQRKTHNSSTLAFAGKASYTEPLSKVAYVEANYGVTVNNSTAGNFTYNRLAGTDVFSTTPNDTFTSNYTYNILSNAAGLNFKFVYSKINFSFGGDVSNADFVQNDLFHADSAERRYNFLNFFPRANFVYRIGKQTSLNFLYQGSTQQPSITQIQPLRQNTDPLNIIEGNTNLTQEFIHKFNLRFNDFKILGGRYMWGNVNFNLVDNAISTSRTTTFGVNRTQYVNVDGNYSGFAFLGWGKNLKKLDINIGVQVNGSLNHVNNFVDGMKNANDNMSFNFGPYVSYTKTDKFEFTLRPSATWLDNKSTISTFSTSYWMFNSDFEGTVFLPLKFEVGTSVDVMIRQNTPVFTTNNNVVRWNAYVSKKFLKKSQLELRASVFDILNQNIGYNRSAQASVITEDRYNTIKRYGMLSLIWNFSHTPAGAPQQPQGNMIIMHK